MRLENCPTPAQVATRCADLVERCLREHAEPVLLLPAGNTPVLLFGELVARHKRGQLDLAQAHLFQLDELVGVSPEDPRSFQRFMRDHVQAPTSLPEAKLHLLDGSAVNPAAGIARHADELRELGGAHLALLGIGANGHVAFNEPGASRTDAARLIELAPTTLAGLRNAFEEGELPTYGITLGIAEILASREVALLATGSSKAQVVLRLLHESASEAFPASLLLEHDSLHVFLDDEASTLLPAGT